MSNLLACRLGSYGKYSGRGWTHLKEIGIHHVELAVVWHSFLLALLC